MNWWKFTYNQGLFIGGATELFKSTQDKNYLKKAAIVVSYILTQEVENSSFGNVLTDGDANQCQGDCTEFKGPTIRYLAEYYQATGDNDVKQFILNSANAVWNLARNEADLFAVSWSGPSPSPTDQVSENQQNAAAMALSAAAKVCS